MLDFQTVSKAKFDSENSFSMTFVRLFLRELKKNPGVEVERFQVEMEEKMELPELFEYLSDICASGDKPIVLMIDEVDSVSNNQVFLDLLAQLRAYYINRDEEPTFQSVILQRFTM